MKTFKIVLVTLVTLVVLAAAAFFLIGYFKPKPAGIYVDASPTSSVYIDGAFIGKTPVRKTFDPGTKNLKIVPDVTDQSLISFETKITLVSGIETVVRRELGKNEDESSGDIISFEKEVGTSAGLIVVSTPDNAQVSIDGIPRGFAPYKTSSISPAQHQVTVKSSGFLDRVMTVTTKPGFRLTLFVKLAKGNQPSEAINPTPTPAPEVYVLILDTPTGYLRVRSEPGTKGEEVGQVKPGEKFLYIETDKDTGWIKIRFQEPKPGLPNGFSGWVSNQYAEIINGEGIPVASQSASPTPRTP
jgi:hypothetical protein